MAEGEHITKDGVVLPQACPFCGNAMGKEKEESCIEAASVEVARITPKIADLKSVQKSLRTEIADKEAHREKLQARMKEWKIRSHKSFSRRWICYVRNYQDFRWH